MIHSHLSKTASQILELSLSERVQHIKKPRWIGYPKANEIIADLEELIEHPHQPRMPNRLIIGETNNGKTVLVDRFRKRHQPEINEFKKAIDMPVLYFQAPPTPSERSIYVAILNQMFKPYGRHESIEAKRDRAVTTLSEVNLKIILIDEIQHILAGSYSKQRACLNTLKYLSNELSISIVGVGTPEAARALHTDPQLSNRFTPFVLPKWQYDNEFLSLLASFERIIPLAEPSHLSSKSLSKLILAATERTIGEISTLLDKAAIFAIKNGSEKITAEVIQECGYISPNERKRRVASL